MAIVIGACVAVAGVAVGIPYAQAACDNVAIIRCGVTSEQDLKQKYNENKRNAQTVYQSFGISGSDLNGFVDGTVYKDGRVVVDGKTVATGAQTAGYNWGTGDPNRQHIAGTEAYIYSTSQLVSDARRTMVKMENGVFKFGVIYDCGNPVKATPVPQPAPEKEIQVCELATKKVITIKEKDFDQTRHSKNLKDCESVKPVEKKISVCELATKKIIQIKESEFDSSKHSRDMKDCESVKPVEKQIKVCDLTTNTLITIKEDEFDSKKHTKDLTQCEQIKVCRLSDKAIVTVARSEMSSDYTTDFERCKEAPVTPAPVQPKPAAPKPVEALPETGAMEVVSGSIGMGSVVGAGYYYLASRRFIR